MSTLASLARVLGACVLAVGLSAGAQEPQRSALRWRVIEPWIDPATGTGRFNHDRGLLTWDAMLKVGPDTVLGRYLERAQGLGFNGFCLSDTDVEANPAAVRSLCHYLKGLGISTFAYRDWNEAEGRVAHAIDDPRPRSSPALNPFGAQARAFWRARIARDWELVPELAGYRMDGAEYYFSNGAPWMGSGSGTEGKTGWECAREAIRLVAGELAPHGGTLFWESCEDDPWGQRQEAWYYRGMTGEIPSNAFVIIKDHYWDFHPGWPPHPLAGALTKDALGRSPYLTSIQLPGEYTGANDVPWCRVSDITETLGLIAATGQQGIWVVDQPLSRAPWDHPLNGVNWYALREAMRNPNAEPAALELAWARAEFGPEAAPVLVEILKQTTEAARGMYEFAGLWNACHSRFPGLKYLDSHLCGPYRQVRRMTGMMGFILPLDMYPPGQAERLRADSRTRMVFNQYPITAELKAQAMAEKDGGVAAMNKAIVLWESLRGRVGPQRHAEILSGLKANRDDAIAFRWMMDLYFDLKLGKLTEARIDAALDACRNLSGCAVPQPLDPRPAQVTSVAPASLKTFAEELRRELRHPALEPYWQDHPTGVVSVEPSAQDNL